MSKGKFICKYTAWRWFQQPGVGVTEVLFVIYGKFRVNKSMIQILKITPIFDWCLRSSVMMTSVKYGRDFVQVSNQCFDNFKIFRIYNTEKIYLVTPTPGACGTTAICSWREDFIQWESIFQTNLSRAVISVATAYGIHHPTCQFTMKSNHWPLFSDYNFIKRRESSACLVQRACYLTLMELVVAKNSKCHKIIWNHHRDPIMNTSTRVNSCNKHEEDPWNIVE